MLKKRKRKLFFHCGSINPILATELELINDALKNDEEVILVNAIYGLDSTYWNPFLFAPFQNLCNSKFERSIKKLKNNKNFKLIYFKNKNFNIGKIKNSQISSINKLRKIKFYSSPIGYGIASSIQTLLKDNKPNLGLKQNRDLIHKKYVTSIKIYNFIKQIILEYQPNEIFIFNGRINESWTIVCLAEKYKINYFTYEIANLKNSYYEIHKNTLPMFYDYNIKFPKKINKLKILKKKREIDKFVNKDPIFFDNSSWTNHTTLFRKSFLPKNFNKKLRNFCIFNNSLEELDSVRGNALKARKKSPNDIIFELLKKFNKEKNFFFYLRLHPNLVSKNILSKNITTQFQEIIQKGKKYRNLKIIWPEEKVDSYELLKNCEKVITFGSTIGFEASYMGKPVVCINNKKSQGTNYAYFPKSFNETVNLIKKKLKPKPKFGSLYYFYLRFNRGNKMKYCKQIKDKWYFKNQLIEPGYSSIFNYYLKKIIYLTFSFDLEKIYYKVKNSYLFRKFFVYY